VIYSTGAEVDKDIQKGINYYEKAIKQNHPTA